MKGWLLVGSFILACLGFGWGGILSFEGPNAFAFIGSAVCAGIGTAGFLSVIVDVWEEIR